MTTTAPPISADTRPRHTFFSFARLSAIASNTLLELVRLKVFYFLLIFALVIIGSSAFAASIFHPGNEIEQQFQILKDVSLGAMSIFTWMLSVLVTAMLLPKDVEDRTLYSILAKPVSRLEYMLGKLVGVLLLVLISTLLMSAVFVMVLYAWEQWTIAQIIAGAGQAPAAQAQVQETVHGIRAVAFSFDLVPAIVALYLKACICAALTLVISTFATSWIFTIFISVTAYIIGYIQHIARESWMNDPGTMQLTKVFLALVTLAFPDMQLFDLVDDIIAGNSIALGLFLKTAGLSAAYVCVYTLVANLIFAFKEL